MSGARGPADSVRQFEGMPRGQWVADRGEHYLILPDGSYASVAADDEATGHWFGDVVFADGSLFDTWGDDPETVKAECETALRRGTLTT